MFAVIIIAVRRFATVHPRLGQLQCFLFPITYNIQRSLQSKGHCTDYNSLQLQILLWKRIMHAGFGQNAAIRDARIVHNNLNVSVTEEFRCAPGCCSFIVWRGAALFRRV